MLLIQSVCYLFRFLKHFFQASHALKRGNYEVVGYLYQVLNLEAGNSAKPKLRPGQANKTECAVGGLLGQLQ